MTTLCVYLLGSEQAAGAADAAPSDYSPSGEAEVLHHVHGDAGARPAQPCNVHIRLANTIRMCSPSTLLNNATMAEANTSASDFPDRSGSYLLCNVRPDTAPCWLTPRTFLEWTAEDSYHPHIPAP